MHLLQPTQLTKPPIHPVDVKPLPTHSPLPEPAENRRKQIVDGASLVVIKIGTRVLTHTDGRLNSETVAGIAHQVHKLLSAGKQIVLVSSGAVGAGLSHLGWPSRPTDLAKLQAVAAIGQTKLIEEYDRHLGQHDRHAAQVLLTAGDLDDRLSYLNVRNTLLSLLELGVVPIINENDTVAVEELMTTFGDNDRLAAIVSNLLHADLLVILSDIDGLYDRDPQAADAKLLDTVASIDENTFGYVLDRDTGQSKGGMQSKLAAAKAVTDTGKHVIIANGHSPTVLDDIFSDQSPGTLFLAENNSVSSRKRWIGYSARPVGTITIDQGAADALTHQGRSLLPIGITSLSGGFAKGDLVQILGPSGKELARGLTNYDNVELQSIIGKRTGQIAEILGHCPYDEAIHRDNLQITL